MKKDPQLQQDVMAGLNGETTTRSALGSAGVRNVEDRMSLVH